jgi:hypothetical protein
MRQITDFISGERASKYEYKKIPRLCPLVPKISLTYE